MKTNAESVYLDTRLSGQVTRYHTWPRVREQSVAEHSWQLLRIYSCVVDQLDQDFVLHCIYHDTAEIVTGDLPYPIKSKTPELKKSIDQLEVETIAKQGDYWNPSPYHMTEEQLQLFKMIEMVEMFEWGLDEMMHGCQYGSIVADRCLRVVYEKVYSVTPLPEQWRRLCLYVYKRLTINEIKADQPGWWDYKMWDRK